MKKYYTMKECFDECGDDDTPFIEDDGFGFNQHIPNTKKVLMDMDVLFVSPKAAISDKWQIKRAEQKVLTDDQWLKDIYGNDYNNQDYTAGDMRWAFNTGEENGQLKEWLRPEQVDLRKTIKDFCYEPGSNINYWTKKFKILQRNLYKFSL